MLLKTRMSSVWICSLVHVYVRHRAFACVGGNAPTHANRQVKGITRIEVPSLLALVRPYVHKGAEWSPNRASRRFFTTARGGGRRKIFGTGLFLFPAEFPNSGSVITGSADIAKQM